MRLLCLFIVILCVNAAVDNLMQNKALLHAISNQDYKITYHLRSVPLTLNQARNGIRENQRSILLEQQRINDVTKKLNKDTKIATNYLRNDDDNGGPVY